MTKNKIKVAKEEIQNILDRFGLSLSELISGSYSKKEAALIWRKIKKDYEKIQKELFAKYYS